MDIIRTLASELEIQDWQAEAAVKLIDDGNTIPFISRYRKEATGALNDEVLRKLFERLNYLRNLEEKKMQVLSTIEEQGKLTDELRAQIEAAQTLLLPQNLLHRCVSCPTIALLFLDMPLRLYPESFPFACFQESHHPHTAATPLPGTTDQTDLFMPMVREKPGYTAAHCIIVSVNTVISFLTSKQHQNRKVKLRIIQEF